MKRKKKFPKMKRALPLALVVVMMMTMFVVSASAMTFEESGVCEHVKEDKVLLAVPTENALDLYNTGVLKIDCDECAKRYIVSYDPTNTDGINDENPFVCFVITHEGYFSDVDGAIMAIDNQPAGADLQPFDGGYYTKIKSIVVEDIVGSSEDIVGSSMVGEMTDTITTSFGGLLKGVGASFVNFFDKTVIAENGGLTTLATWTLAFLGIGFGFMVVKFITNKVRKK